MILGPDKDLWSSVLVEAGFPEEQFTTALVKQDEVADYLSAADFAYSLHRPSPSKIGISPIKNAEYFSSGLPVLIPGGIGDDSEEVRINKLGVTFDLQDTDRNAIYNALVPLIDERQTSCSISEWAQKNRSFQLVESCYDKMLSNLMS